MEKLVLANNMITSVKQNLIDGLTIASGAKSSSTYYHNKDEQLTAIRNQIKKLYNQSKELPLIIATQKGVTGTFISQALLNEFKETFKGGACNIVNPIDWYDNGLSDKAILSALNNLGENNGLPYVLRLFIDLKNYKVNNERSRKIMLGYLWGQTNLEFYSIKYRNKIANTLRHIYGEKRTSMLLTIAQKQVNGDGQIIGTNKEISIANNLILKYYYSNENINAFKLLLFLFKKDDGVEYSESEFPLIAEYQKAKTDIKNVQNVPEEILLGLISDTKHPQYHSMWATESLRKETMKIIRENVKVTSINQQVRQTKSTSKLGVDKVVDMSKATDFLALYKTGYETTFTPEIIGAIDKLAEKKKIDNFLFKNIGIILDKSISMTGHQVESKNTPKAIADFTKKVLEKSANSSIIEHTDEFYTDIATSFINLMKNETEKPFDAIFILTDGYENVYDGLTNEVIQIYKAETARDIPIFQISPITGAEMEANVRNLGKDIVTMAINNPVAIQPQINARLLEIDAKRWLENQFKSLENKEIKRNKKTSINI